MADPDQLADSAARETICDFAGHDWTDAGGGRLICGECFAEKWAGEEDPRG